MLDDDRQPPAHEVEDMPRTLSSVTRDAKTLWQKYLDANCEVERQTKKIEGYEIALGHKLAEAKSLLAEANAGKSRGKSKTPRTTWPAYVKEHFAFGSRRADELIQIATGKTTVAKMRKRKQQSMKTTRANSAPRGAGKSSRSAAARAQRNSSHDACDEVQYPDTPKGEDETIFHFRWLALEAREAAKHAAAIDFAGKIVSTKLVTIARDVASAWSAIADDLVQRSVGTSHNVSEEKKKAGNGQAVA